MYLVSASKEETDKKRFLLKIFIQLKYTCLAFYMEDL